MRSLVTACVLASAFAAHAETVTERATRLFDEGLALKDEGHNARACERFEESVALVVAPGTQFAVAECAERAGEYYRAWELFTAAATAFSRDAKDIRAQKARERADAAETKLGTVVVELADPDIKGLIVNVGARRIAPAAKIRERANPGIVEITAMAPGRQPFSGQVRLSAGEAATIDVPALAPLTTTVTDTSTHRRRSYVYLAGGIAAASIGAGVIGTLKFLDARQQYAAPESPVERAKHTADIATLWGVGSIALGAVAIYVFVTAPRDRVVTPTPTGVAIIGRF